jgi:hypothetical protein
MDIVTAGADRSVRQWDLVAERQTLRWDLPHPQWDVAVSADGRTIVSCGHTARIHAWFRT